MEQRSLAIDQPVRPTGIEPHDPVAHDLQTHAADPRRIALMNRFSALGTAEIVRLA